MLQCDCHMILFVFFFLFGYFYIIYNRVTWKKKKYTEKIISKLFFAPNVNVSILLPFHLSLSFSDNLKNCT